MDVFPLFYVPSALEERKRQKEEILKWWKAIRGWNAIQNHLASCDSVYDEYIPYYESIKDEYSIDEIKQFYMDACVSSDQSDEIGNTSFRTHKENFIWKKEWFEDTVELPFEDTTVVCPKCYDEVLTKTYGDWRTPVFGTSFHELYIVDTETPFEKKEGLY